MSRMSSNSSRPSIIPPHCSTRPPSIIVDTATSPSMSQPIIRPRSSIRLSSSSFERGRETAKLLPSAATKTKKRTAPDPSSSTSSGSNTNKRRKVKKEAADARSQTTRSFEPAWWGNSISSHPRPTETDYYPPIHTLILGTHPSIASSRKVELYAHTQNAFWYIVGDVLHFRRNAAISTTTTTTSSSPSVNKNKPYATYYDYLRYTNIIPYDEQLGLLVSKGFALWDIIAARERKGSSDKDIRNEGPNRMREFCEGTYPSLSDDGCKVEEDDGGCNGNAKNNNDDNVKCEKNKYVNIQRIIIANGTTGAKFFIKYFTNWFLEGKLCVANNDMSQKAFKSILNKMNNQKSAGQQQQHKIEIVVLPSVSPAAASITYIQKREAWETYCYTPGLIDYNNWAKTKKMTSSKYRQLSFMEQENAPLDIIASPSSHATTKMTTTMMTPPSSKKSKSRPDKVTSSSSSSSSSSTSPTKVPAIRLLSSDLELLAPENPWIDLRVSPSELRPSATLTNGQCFNWLVVDSDTPPTQSAASSTLRDGEEKVTTSAWGTHDAREWVGPLHDRVLSIRETSTTTLVRVLHGPTEDVITDMRYYFRLDVRLLPLYEIWSTRDDRLAKIAESIPGVRIVRQDPHECLFSFICTSNNNIPRITKILSSFRERYGTLLMDLPTRRSSGGSGGYSSENDVLSTMSLYSFPTLADLENVSESDLRTLGLGYRAKFVIETRDLLRECGGTDYLMTLRSTKGATVVQDELIVMLMVVPAAILRRLMTMISSPPVMECTPPIRQ